MHQRVHNILCALIVICCLGVTAWSIAVREPTIAQTRFSVPRGGSSLPVQAMTETKDAEPTRKAAGEKGKGDARVERLIDEGKLSKHPARFYQKVDP